MDAELDYFHYSLYSSSPLLRLLHHNNHCTQLGMSLDQAKAANFTHFHASMDMPPRDSVPTERDYLELLEDRTLSRDISVETEILKYVGRQLTEIAGKHPAAVVRLNDLDLDAWKATISAMRPSPDLIIVGIAADEAVWRALPPESRKSDSRFTHSGWDNLLFQGVPVIYDSMRFTNEPNTAYFVNSEHLSFTTAYLSEEAPCDERASGTFECHWAGALTCSL